MDSDEYDHGNDNCQNDPPAQLNALFKISNTGCHRSTIVDQLFVSIERHYAIENNHGLNGYHRYSFVIRHLYFVILKNIRVIRVIRGSSIQRFSGEAIRVHFKKEG